MTSRDGSPNSSVFADIMKLLANSWNEYQTKDCSRHILTKILNGEKTHSAINSEMFKRPSYSTDQLYEVELEKTETEHKGPMIVGFFVLHHVKKGMLELYYKLFKKF